MLFIASWDKIIRCVDLEINKVVKSFIGSKEAIKCLRIFNNDIFVAGCDPIIRGFNLQTGDHIFDWIAFLSMKSQTGLFWNKALSSSVIVSLGFLTIA
jgi:WD40 repeat protein